MPISLNCKLKLTKIAFSQIAMHEFNISLNKKFQLLLKEVKNRQGTKFLFQKT